MMNERIRELAEQAGMGFGKPFKQTEDTLYIKSDKVSDAIATNAVTHQKQILKFAELLVRECVGIARQNNNSGEGGVIAQTIEQHFGVE